MAEKKVEKGARAKRKYLAMQTLKAIAQRLLNTSFQRIHRNALVNIDHVLDRIDLKR